LADLVNDVLYLSQIDANRMATETGVDILPGNHQYAVEAVQALYISKGLPIRVILPTEAIKNFCDKTPHSRNCYQSMSNAGRFTETGRSFLVPGRVTRKWSSVLQTTGPGGFRKLDQSGYFSLFSN